MATFQLTTGNDRVRLNRREEDTIVVESASRRDTDIILGFDNQDKIDLSAFDDIDAQELIDEAIPRGRRNVILRGEFGRLALIGVTKNQLSPEMFITDDSPVMEEIIGNNLLSTETGTRERLEGGPGNDVIIGNRGADILSGGAGADVFEYNSLTDSGADPAAPNEGGDDIIDFDPTVDTIELDFEVAPGIMVRRNDVEINTDFIDNGAAIIGLNTSNTPPDFLPEQFIIRLIGLDPTTTETDIRRSIEFG